MIAEILKILSGYGTSIVSQIQSNLSSTGSNATGKTSRSVRFEVKEETSKLILRVLAKPFFFVVETGRKATPQFTKPSKTFVDSIKEWLVSRGKSELSAYGIARSIHQHGTKLWQAGGRKDIVSNVVNQSLFDQIAKDSLDKFANFYLLSAVKTFHGTNRSK